MTTLDDFDTPDPALDEVVDAFLSADPNGERTAQVFRDTFDQLYDGQHTGRYSVDQLYKTEKTHFGTLIEINLRREFTDVIADARDEDKLDYVIAGHHVDCKFSFTYGGWMLPPECFEQLLIVCNANDSKSEWAMGVVRATADHRRQGANRDAKVGLNNLGRNAIHWLHRPGTLPPNVLLDIDPEVRAQIFAHRSGQQKLNELFRRVTGVRIGRAAVAAVAKQDDYMKRARGNGGSRTALAPEGYIIPGGDYSSHRNVAEALGVEVPQPGEFVSIRVVPASASDPNTIALDGQLWRVAGEHESPVVAAPSLPSTKKFND